MSVDLSKIRPGDEVTVRVIVKEVLGRGELRVRTLQEVTGSVILPEHVVSHTPKALSVGDRVKVFHRTGAVEAIKGRYAWVFYDSDDGLSTELLSDLERIP